MVVGCDNSKLQTDGFVVLPLLSADEICYINTLVKKYLPADKKDFVSSSHYLPIDESKYINKELQAIVQPKMALFTPDLELLGGTLATKTKGANHVEAHNDWNIVDETRYNSYNLWIALVNTDRDNGTLGLLPGSHNWHWQDRGMGIDNPYGQFTKKIMQIGYEPKLEAGSAILYNHKLIHYSRPNTTDIPRNVAIIGMKDKEAALQVSLSNDGKNIQCYRATQDDFYGFDMEKVVKNNPLIISQLMKSERVNLDMIYANYKKYCSNQYQKNITSKEVNNIFEIIKKKFNFFWNHG